jgi:hypothetical protein
MTNQAKVKLYDQLIKGCLVELGEVLEKAEVEFERWHIEQIKNYVNVLDVAYQRIASGDKTEDDATTKGEIRSNKEQSKLTEEVRMGKEILVNVDIMDIFDEDETTSLSQLYPQSTIKEKPSNTNIDTNLVGAFEEPTKGFQKPEVGTEGKGVET